MQSEPAAVPGISDVWNRVNEASPNPEQSTTETARRRRRWPWVTGLTAAAVVAAGGAAVGYENAHKTITLDVDGRTTTVATLAGSVDGLLEEEGVRLAERDLVAPDPAAALRDGGEVIVRYARQLTIESDGDQRDIWVTALDADEALRTLAERGADATLVPSRSGDRASLPLRLDAEEPVTLVVGGKDRLVEDASMGLEDMLTAQGVKLDRDDRIHVERRPADELGDPTVRVVVERVQVDEVTKRRDVPFKTRTVTDSDRYADLGTAVEREGKEGVRTVVFRVTRVDGEVVTRKKISDEVTRKPVTKILVEGTKERPEPEPEPEPAPEPVESSSDSSSSSSSSSGSSSSDSSSSSSSSSGGGAPTSGVWAALAQCESGGDPTTNTGNGYYGLYQFSLPTWQAMGGSGLPSEASASEQTMRAQRLQQQSGWGQWPACAAKLGLL
jgi:uncharacterized protein YabE (DUF348 family)